MSSSSAFESPVLQAWRSLVTSDGGEVSALITQSKFCGNRSYYAVEVACEARTFLTVSRREEAMIR
jgi:hypothetical protein